jgi:hypothetical protein
MANRFWALSWRSIIWVWVAIARWSPDIWVTRMLKLSAIWKLASGLTDWSGRPPDSGGGMLMGNLHHFRGGRRWSGCR